MSDDAGHGNRGAMDAGELKDVRASVLRRVAVMLVAGRESGLTIVGGAGGYALHGAEQQGECQQHAQYVSLTHYRRS
jgi:hypothetical protein